MKTEQQQREDIKVVSAYISMILLDIGIIREKLKETPLSDRDDFFSEVEDEFIILHDSIS